MFKTILATDVMDKLDSYSLNFLRQDSSYSYNHEILWYGIDALAHVYLMSRLKKSQIRGISSEEFVKDFQIEFTDRTYYTFLFPVKRMDRDNIFIPWQTYVENDGRKSKREVSMFCRDYGSSFEDLEWVNDLMDKDDWTLEDLCDEELPDKGILFGKLLWGRSVANFHKYKNGHYRVEDGERVEQLLPAQDKDLTSASEFLIGYYSGLIAELEGK